MTTFQEAQSKPFLMHNPGVRYEPHFHAGSKMPSDFRNKHPSQDCRMAHAEVALKSRTSVKETGGAHLHGKGVPIKAEASGLPLQVLKGDISKDLQGVKCTSSNI